MIRQVHVPILPKSFLIAQNSIDEAVTPNFLAATDGERAHVREAIEHVHREKCVFSHLGTWIKRTWSVVKSKRLFIRIPLSSEEGLDHLHDAGRDLLPVPHAVTDVEGGVDVELLG